MQIASENITSVFVDGSNLGEVVRSIKKNAPTVRIYTFFHNVEARFFWGSWRQTKTLRTLGVLLANYLAERKALRFSDEIICLNQRDSDLLQRIYHRSANHVFPIAIQDKFLPAELEALKPVGERYALFVGGAFYANQQGISWFVENVVPFIDVKLCIVGKGMEDLRKSLERVGKVEVIGEVDSLSEWYLNCHFVVAPIFDGSGMKTKVAEALMFGKKIIGTPEAFTGYEEILGAAGRVCSTADQFIDAIGSSKEIVETQFDLNLRKIYLEKYSYEAACKRYEDVLSDE